MILRTALTSWSRGMVCWPGRSAFQAALSASPSAAMRPASRSLMVTVPDGPGLGADPDMAVLRKYLLAQPTVHKG